MDRFKASVGHSAFSEKFNLCSRLKPLFLLSNALAPSGKRWKVRQEKLHKRRKEDGLTLSGASRAPELLGKLARSFVLVSDLGFWFLSVLFSDCVLFGFRLV